jgi:hypothetical protein
MEQFRPSLQGQRDQSCRLGLSGRFSGISLLPDTAFNRFEELQQLALNMGLGGFRAIVRHLRKGLSIAPIDEGYAFAGLHGAVTQGNSGGQALRIASRL